MLQLRFTTSTLLVILSISPAWAQTPSIDRGSTGTLYTAYDSLSGTGVIQLSAYAENKNPLDRQALIKLTNLETKASTWQTTQYGARVVIPNIPFGSYNVEVSAVGYLPTSQELHLITLDRLVDLKVVLKKDPSAISFEVNELEMPRPARKQMKQAVAALKSNNLEQAQRHLDAVAKSAGSSAQLNFLLGYLYFQKHEYDQAGQYLTQSLDRQPENFQALILLGRSALERADYRGAESPLVKAIAIDGEDWLARSLLADVYLHQHNYEAAQSQAKLAIEKGRSAASSAQLVIAQILLAQGKLQEGTASLREFLHETPNSGLAPQVRDLIAQAERQESSPRDPVATASPSSADLDALQALPAARMAVQAWQPTGIDEVKPSVAANTVCPSDDVITKAGEHVVQLVDDLSRFAAIEDLFHQRLDKYGIPISTETRKYNYVASISEPEPGYLDVDEFREERLTRDGYPDHIASIGFVTLAFIFHPHVRENFDLQCEGLGDWQGQATWLVHFRQRPDRPNRMHSYKLGSELIPVGLKGRAWIRADNFQIVRMESELDAPMPEIQLRGEHQVVDYGPVPFANTGTSLWLPHSAAIYLDFRHQRFYRRHSFDHYMLFSVGSDEKRKEPSLKTSLRPESQ